mgnify:CR=1 FL=1
MAESARLLVEQGEQLVSDFANERFLAGVGGGAAVADAPRQMYGDESMCAPFFPAVTEIDY